VSFSDVLPDEAKEKIPDWLDPTSAHLLPLKFEAFMIGL
jgi:hypothetical protein